MRPGKRGKRTLSAMTGTRRGGMLLAGTLALAGLAGCASTHHGSGQLARPASIASTRATAAAAAKPVVCGLLKCSRGRVGQKCTMAGYPGIIVQTSATSLGCDPKPGNFPSASAQPSATAPPGTVSGGQPVSFNCQMGYVNLPVGEQGTGYGGVRFQTYPPAVDNQDGYTRADYIAMEITVTASQTATVGSVNVVWYVRGGVELESGSEAVGQIITTGQSLSFVYDGSSGENNSINTAPPAAGATCDVVSWSQ